MKSNQDIPPPPLPPPIRVIKGDKLVIKDIVEQEKHKRTLAKIKKREESITRKQFLKDCYKFWKEYKKVESPYFWWLGWFSIWNLDEKYYLDWYRLDAPKSYKDNSWFEKKWVIEDYDFCCVNVHRKADPNLNRIYFYY